MLQSQNDLRAAAAFPVIVVFAGVDGAGKGETVNLLNEWMDPRWIVTRAFGEPSDEEQERPEYWRFWRALPPRGRIGLFLSSWYSRPVLDRVYGRIDANAFEERLNRIVEFEQTLADDGALILKFWMHLDKARQKKHLKRLEKDRASALEGHRRSSGSTGGCTTGSSRPPSTPSARPAVATRRGPSSRARMPRYRSLTVGTMILDGIRGRLAQVEAERSRPSAAAGQPNAKTATRPRPKRSAGAVSILSSLDMSKRAPKDAAEERVALAQGRLNLLQRKARAQGRLDHPGLRRMGRSRQGRRPSGA